MLNIKDLSFSYGKRCILHHINTAIADGEMCAIMGANGSGKTTLLRLIASLLTPISGTILYNDTHICQMPARQRAKLIALVSQHSNTSFNFSAEDIVLMARTPYQHPLQADSDNDRAIALEAMRLTHTEHLRKAYPNELSGGELQRVMIARALAQQTPIILLDEPLANLDIEHQLNIMQLLSDINQQQHKTILIIVHNLNIALQYCPHLMLLHDKQILYHGPTCQGLTQDNIRKVFNVDSERKDNYITIQSIST